MKSIYQTKKEERQDRVMKWALIVIAGYFIIRIVVSLIWGI